MPEPQPFLVGRKAEVVYFDTFLSGDTSPVLLNIFGPGGIGKSVVCRKLADHARNRGIPVATLDGINADLTADRALYALHRELTQGPAGKRLRPALRELDRLFREHLVIQQVLTESGGLHALFDAFGSLKDPLGLTALFARLGDKATTSVRDRLRNRFALDSYLRGADHALMSSFREGLSEALSEPETGGRLAILIDTYEEMEDLDDWVFGTLVPALPSAARLVIFGRNPLPRVNFYWNDFGPTLALLALPELSEAESRSYLHYYGLSDPAAQDLVYRITGGYPLLLVLARQLAQEAGGWDGLAGLERASDRDRMASQLLERILREEKVAELRDILEKGVVARWLDPEIISVLLEVSLPEARILYDRLQRHSFMEHHPLGLRFHDKIRELLLARLEFTSLAEARRLQERLAAYHAEKAGLGEAPRPPTPEAATAPRRSTPACP